MSAIFEHDLIIIGGGVNGAALARLASFQGLRAALFEAGDFGQGASTNTSKLLHGGLRYLETFDFGLVRDAVRERAELLATAPHLVEARRFLFPHTVLGRHPRVGIKAGLTLYDFLAGNHRIAGHQWVTPERLREMEPYFRPDEACGAYEYSDCVMDDARLIMENLIDAQALGARIHNYTSFQSLAQDGKGSVEVTVLDRFTGREQVHVGRSVAFTLGPWTDAVLSKAYPGRPPQARLSQGIHLIADGLPSHSCFILPVPRSKRYFFVVPWKGRHLIGTTETEVGDRPPEPAQPQAQEIAELLALTETYFPGQKLDVVCTMTGIRPLARTGKGSTVTLSREQEFHRMEENVFSAVGGKYTTHRSFADAFLRFILGKNADVRDIKPRPLPGAWADPNERTAILDKVLAYPFANDRIAVTWLLRYGKRALDLAAYIGAESGRDELLSGPEPLLRGEVLFSAEREWAKTPVDFFRRRTDLYFTRGAGLQALDQVRQCLDRIRPGGRTSLAALGAEADYAAFLKGNLHRAAG